MAYREDDSDEYLPDSDDSDHQDERPNRWTGPPSTWQQLNSAEIDTLTTLHLIRNQDLSIHLYNAFALRNRHTKRTVQAVTRPVPNQDVDITTGQPVQEDKWIPPKSWTAWPLPVEVVPPPEFMKRGDDTDVVYRMHVPYTPKSELEEVISATMLRLAKENFQARLATQQGDTAEEVGPGGGDEDGSVKETSSIHGRGRSTFRGKSAGSRARVKKEGSESNSEMMDIDDPHPEKRSSSTAPEPIPLEAVVATDDELSYTLLRPTAQGILSQLDTTLTVLHHAQESRFCCPSESSASSASSRSQSQQSRSHSRGQGPARKRTRSPAPRNPPDPYSRASSAAPPEQPGGDVVKKRGRPKKIYPRLDGETDRDYEVRIARLRKKPIPSLLPAADDDGNGNENENGNGNASESARAPHSAAESTNDNTTQGNPSAQKNKPKTARASPQQQPRRRRRRESSDALSDATSATATSNSIPTNKKKKKPFRFSRVRLRDWRDVLGAAALAGFPAAAIDRAARRCADLFGQDFALHTLIEGPAEENQQQQQQQQRQQQRQQGGAKLDKRVRYGPGMSMPIPTPSLLGDEGEDNGGDGAAAVGRVGSYSHSRGSRGSRGRGRSASAGPSRSKNKSQSQSRSASASASAGGRYYCVVRSCPRAIDGFTRRMNLLRHLKLVHNYDGDVVPAAEVDSEDEMCGAVHVDGFLRPIKIRPGWLGDEGIKGKGKSRPRKRAREVESAEEEGEEMTDMSMRDVDSTTGGETSG